MPFLTRKRGTRKQIGTKFPIGVKHKLPRVIYPKVHRSMDPEIVGLVKYLSIHGARTTNSCAHDGTVDITNVKNTRKAMRNLGLPKGSWRVVDYAKDSPLEGKKHLWVLQILGAKVNTKRLQNKVASVSKTAISKMQKRK